MNHFKSSESKAFRISGFILLIIIALIIPIISCTSQNSAFYNKVLNDFDSTSYFISLNIKSPSFKGRAIIENRKLYLFLNQTKGFNEKRYQLYMEKMLSHRRVMKVEEKDFSRFDFRKVYDDESVIRNTVNGRDNFIAYYFNGSVLNLVLSEKELNAVISQLFYWEIPAKYDKLTRELIIG
jgi:hypothetical protein